MKKRSELAARPDFRLGSLSVSPARRLVEGPSGKVKLEPLVMCGFLLLIDHRDRVVTRDELFDGCWGAAMVGDDSLNRAIARIRKVDGEVGPGLFKIETIPRTGYRLVGDLSAAPIEPVEGNGAANPLLMPRRIVLASFAAAGLGAAGFFWGRDGTRDKNAAYLIEQGRQFLRDDLPSSNAQGVEFFRGAVARQPENGEAWGLLAVALRNAAEKAPPDKTSQAVRECEDAARRALAINPRDGNALIALATVRPYFGDWLAGEQRIRKVLQVAPDNAQAYYHLTTLLQSVGRAQDSWNANEKALAIDPLSPIPYYRKALKYWIFGRTAQADAAIDRGLQLWPKYPAMWSARLYIFAFTGRAQAATVMIQDSKLRPDSFRQPSAEQWLPSLKALDTRDPADIRAATEANLHAAPRSPGFADNAIMILSALGKLDEAYSVADGLWLRRGPMVGTLWTGEGQMPVNDGFWRRTMSLFTPANAALRADPRYSELCRNMGLTDYWRDGGVGPDPMFRQA